MAYWIRKTQAFEADYANILDEVSVHGSSNAVAKLVNNVDKALLFLETIPLAGREEDNLSRVDHPYRVYPVLKYVIIYRVVGNTVVLLRLFHQAQSYQTQVIEW